MSAPTLPATAWPWSADLLAFAAKHQVQSCLQPLLKATQRQFPTAQKLDVYLEEDAEIRNDWHIVFDVHVPQQDVPQFVEAVHRWNAALVRCCPGRWSCLFQLGLQLIPS